ncbi:hypothetical protein B0J13DRAFT_598295 [Dactylonectria estremocensis]|uniref:D-isomer specific 2-hydroxyacid dehydrogenase NAD-binding domain-containing protein n=1 Tax=Dactylonectria estremocensis TaxID=1079267 RepID=A0A9P9E3E2_9HYPO|nr:hypothetical protein B0J13DRAFT_598295 [Dactylonectria estremocensis]
MTLIRVSSNPTLKGHKAIIATTAKAPPAAVEAIRKQFPDLQLKLYVVPWGNSEIGGDFEEEDWKDTTLLLTATVLPTVEQASRIQYVQLSSAGANHILNRPYFSDTKVPFCTANGVHGPQISEWIVATFLSFHHQLQTYYGYQQEGKWKRDLDNAESLDDAVGKRVGILGYGSIGRQTARVAKALGMDVHAYTLHPRTTPESKRDHSYSPAGLGDLEGAFPSKWFSGGSKEEIHEFLGSGLDLLVIATPLTEQTKNLIAKPEFEILSKKRTFVTNIARGPIVNTDDLIEALDKGLIQGAALDVTDPEPLPEGHPLAASSAYYTRVLDIFRLNLERLSQGRQLINEVNRKAGY